MNGHLLAACLLYLMLIQHALCCQLEEKMLHAKLASDAAY